MAEILEYLASSGNIPGLPGNHGPGWYLIDYEERTIRPKPLEQGEPLAQPDMPSVASLNASGKQSQGGVIRSAGMAIVGEVGQPEIITIPDGATINPNLQENVVPADETATPEAETTPDQAQQPMEVVAEPASSVPAEQEATQPEQA